jgi:hypothetical protein
MRKKWVIGLVLVLFVSAGAGLWWKSKQGWTEARLERLIESELPVGTDRIQVEDWLTTHGIPHTYSILSGNRIDSTYSERQAELSKQNHSMVKEEVSSANESLFFRNEIEIFFYFDKQERLAGHTVVVWFDFL